MKTVVSVATMRESDAATVRSGTSARELMYRAGVGVFQSYSWQGRVAIVCGGGNNAGDGYVLALLLSEAGIPCSLILLSDSFSEDGWYYFEQCRKKRIEILSYSPDFSFDAYTEIVDCIYGTGLRGDVTGLTAEVIQRMNDSGKTVISVDINSGLDGDSGCSKLCVRSDLTVSIGFYKSGHLLGRAKDVIDALTNVDIGIGLCGREYRLLEASDAASVFGERLQNSHKGTYGYVSILGGCTRYAGAVKLASLGCAALRAGCGVAKLILPASLAPSVSPYLLESTLHPLPDKDGFLTFDPDTLDEALAGQRALALGMGWGSASSYSLILSHVLKNYDIPLVIDADGLNILAQMDREALRSTRCTVILTPHPGEFARLKGCSTEEVLHDPVAAAEEYAKETGTCVLLKGACTVVTDGEVTYLVNRGCAGMATAGSGDVLSGILAGLLGFCAPTPLTVAAGAYLAGRAGELAQERINPVSMLASDTVASIADAVSELLGSR